MVEPYLRAIERLRLAEKLADRATGERFEYLLLGFLQTAQFSTACSAIATPGHGGLLRHSSSSTLFRGASLAAPHATVVNSLNPQFGKKV